MKKSNKFSPEVRERAARMVQEHRSDYPSLWAAIESITPKIGCVPQTFNERVKRVEVDTGVWGGITTAEAQRVKELQRENKKLRRANEIHNLAIAFLSKRSQVADSSLGRLCGQASPYPRGQADLQGLADCPVTPPLSCSPRAHHSGALHRRAADEMLGFVRCQAWQGGADDPRGYDRCPPTGSAQRSVGVGLYLCRNLAGLAIRGLCD